MRAVVAIGLTLLMAARAPASHADPDAPQLSPGRAQREDAQRLTEQLRGLDHEAPPAPVAAPTPRAQPDAARRRDGAAARDQPLVQRWWFWAALGAAAITAIGVTLEATRSTSEPPFSGVRCDAMGCRP